MCTVQVRLVNTRKLLLTFMKIMILLLLLLLLLLPLTDDVVRQLREKHPDAQRAKLVSLLFGPVEDMPDSVYQEINGEFVREAALRTKGSGGPLGVDANGYKRLLRIEKL